MGFWARVFNWEQKCPTCEVLKTALNNEQADRVTREEKACPTCDALKVQLDIEQSHYRELMDHILHPQQPEIPEATELPKPLVPRHVPWSIEQQRREASDRKKHAVIVAQQLETAAKLEEDRKEEIDKLEKDLDVEVAANG